MSDERLLDEAILHRALRLEADERPARLDAAALQAVALEADRRAELELVALGVATSAGLVGSGALLNFAPLAVEVGGAFAADPLGTATTVASSVIAVLLQASVPASLLAALLLAGALELLGHRQGANAAS